MLAYNIILLSIICHLCFQTELKKLGFEEGRDESLAAERRGLSQSVHSLQEKLETLEARSGLTPLVTMLQWCNEMVYLMTHTTHLGFG